MEGYDHVTWRQLAEFINLDMDEWLKDAPAKIFVDDNVKPGFYHMPRPTFDECCLDSDDELLGFSVCLWNDEFQSPQIEDRGLLKINQDNAKRKQLYMKPYIPFY